MSAGVVVNRPRQRPLDLFPQAQSSTTCNGQETGKSVVLRESPTKYDKASFEADLEQRLRVALKERDERWRKHEKAQIAFLQQESSNMLKGLHAEIERLGHHLRDAKRQLFVTKGVEESSICDHKELEQKLIEQDGTIRELEKIIKQKEEQAQSIETTVTATVGKLQEQITLQADRIRQLTNELNDRNQTVAHLSNQLRSYRLRDAMATAQQRRRASHGNSPLVSPTSPHRVFPPKGLVSASVTVTYPGSKSMSLSSENATTEGPGSIEKPSRRRSASGFGFGK